MKLLLARDPRWQGDAGPALPLAPLDAALLAWLAVEGATPRARLAALLWPGKDESAGRNSLRQRLFRLHRLVGTELVAGQGMLSLAEGVRHDLDRADTLLGDLAVEDLAIGEFAQWLATERTRRRERLRRSLAERAERAEAAAEWDSARALAREVLALEPLSEEAHRRLMRLHYLAGDRAAALLAFDACERLLKDEVGTAPAAETRALLATIESAAAALPQAAPRQPAAVLRPPRLVGRDRELAALGEAWQAGAVVALSAEPGMGKTRLLQDFAATRPGAVRTQARPGDAAVPYATMSRLLGSLQAHAVPGEAGAASLEPPPALAALATPMAGRALAVTAAPPLLERGALQRSLQAWLQERQALGLTGLLIDDLHFADAASLLLLQSWIDEQQAQAGALRVVLAWRPAEAGTPLAQLADALTEQARLQLIALPPLNEAALAELVDTLGLPGVDGRALAPVLRQRTGGNPLFVLETLKLALSESGSALTSASALPRPLSVTRLIERRLSQLSAPALTLARCAAVAGTDFSAALAARVLGASPLALADAWHELEQAQVLRDEAFVHDLLYETALASVPAPIARELHRQIAGVLQAEGRSDAATLARHWLAAGDAAQAAPQLEQAAQAAARAFDAQAASERWLQLLDLHGQPGAATADDTDAAFELATRAVAALIGLSTGRECELLLERQQALARTPRQRVRAELAATEWRLRRGEIEAALACNARAQAALAELDPHGAPDGAWAERVQVLNLEGVLQRRLGDLPAAVRALEAALALARVHDEAAGDLAGVLNNLALAHMESEDHVRAIGLFQESAERQADAATRARVLNNLAISLEERGQVQLAHEQRLAAMRPLAGSGTMVELTLAISLGAAARNLCRYREALAHLDRADTLAAAHKHFRGEDLLRQRAAVWIDLGRFNLAREALTRTERLVAGTREEGLAALLKARWLLAQPDADRAAAVATLESARQALDGLGDRRVLRRLWLLQARAWPAAEALALITGPLGAAVDPDNPGAQLPLRVRHAQALIEHGDAAAALREASRAADWLLAVQPLDMTPAEVWLTLAQAARAAGDGTLAARACQKGLAFVEAVAANQVDAVFVDSWRQRNAVNRALATLATQL